eukprot:209095-Hanusia_phi.AAC.1
MFTTIYEFVSTGPESHGTQHTRIGVAEYGPTGRTRKVTGLLPKEPMLRPGVYHLSRCSTCPRYQSMRPRDSTIIMP